MRSPEHSFPPAPISETLLTRLLSTNSQGDFLTGATEPVTLNVTEDAMTLVWGVLEEVLRLWEMRSGDGGAGGRRVAGDGEGGVSESDDDGEEDIFSEEEVRVHTAPRLLCVCVCVCVCIY